MKSLLAILFLLGCSHPKKPTQATTTTIVSGSNICYSVATSEPGTCENGVVIPPAVVISPDSDQPCVINETMTSCVTRLQERVDHLEKRMDALEKIEGLGFEKGR